MSTEKLCEKCGGPIECVPCDTCHSKGLIIEEGMTLPKLSWVADCEACDGSGVWLWCPKCEPLFDDLEAA